MVNITNDEKLMVRHLLSPLFLNIILLSPSHWNMSRKTKREKRHTDWKGKVKLSIVVVHRTVDAENVNESAKQLLELISKINKVTDHKVKIHNPTY